jgi:hypothetical protein
MSRPHMPQTSPAAKIPATAPCPYDHQLTAHNSRQHQTQKTWHGKHINTSRQARTASAAADCTRRCTRTHSLSSSRLHSIMHTYYAVTHNVSVCMGVPVGVGVCKLAAWQHQQQTTTTHTLSHALLRSDAVQMTQLMQGKHS